MCNQTTSLLTYSTGKASKSMKTTVTLEAHCYMSHCDVKAKMELCNNIDLTATLSWTQNSNGCMCIAILKRHFVRVDSVRGNVVRQNGKWSSNAIAYE